MGRNLILLTALALAVPAVSFADTPDMDRDQVQERDQDRDQDQERLVQHEMEQIRMHLRKKLKMSEADVAGLEPGLNQYFRLHGEQLHVRAMVKAGLDDGCQGVCLQEMVQSTNRAMVWGMQDKQATALVTECLQDRLRERDRTRASWTDGDLGDQVHDQVQDRLRLWERDHERMLDRERDREMQRERERANERARAVKSRYGDK